MIASGSRPQTLEERFHRVGDGRYLLAAPDHLLTEFDVAHIRRERHQLYGELTVRTSLREAHTAHGVLFVADVNLSVLRSREDLAHSLASRTKVDANEWRRQVDDLATCIGMAERTPLIRAM